MPTRLKTGFLDILACPKCRHSVQLDGAFVRCTNAACRLRYPIRDGIPIMLIEEAASTEGPAPKAG